MFSRPDHACNLSQRLSTVLDDIWVNEVMVMKRRRTWMLQEANNNVFVQINSANKSVFYFGSQTEGSTTESLNSDIDILTCDHDIRIIQDWSEWEQGKHQLLMVQDDTTAPGYCLIQAVKSDEPLPQQFVPNEHFSRDSRGRVLLRHSFGLSPTGNRHGPANAVQRGADIFDVDYVRGFHCSSWPKEANSWLQKQNVSGWPTEDMKRYSSEQGCFVVPVGSRTGMHQDTEWRISTSFAERWLMFSLNMTQMRCYVIMKMILKTFIKPKCGEAVSSYIRSGMYQDTEWRISTSFAERWLMFSLNMTQMRCYVIMKMILKTFIKPECGEAVSSFMCKNVLFHCIANSATSSAWNECSLLTCLNQCVQALINCILTEQCPHFIIPGNNLLAGKFTTEVKHQLVEVMCALTGNIEQTLLGVHIENLGERLYVKSGHRPQVYLRPACVTAASIAANNVSFMVQHLIKNILYIQHKFLQDSHILTTSVSKLCQIYSSGSRLYQVASRLYTPFLCSIIGSRKASADIQHSQVLSPEALTWLSLGENSDISSSRLKLASALYCTGDLLRCEGILAATREKLLDTTVVTFCCCLSISTRAARVSRDFIRICYENNEEVIKHNMAFCVTYLPCEVNCIPNEMKYEMFRSTEEDRTYRGEEGFWIYWAVVDSLSYLYFLQYKVYSQLQRPADQHRALVDLATTINTDPNLGHIETAWNLLGQCMEQENKNEDALKCYIMSPRMRARNNAAKWLICCLLARLVNG